MASANLRYFALRKRIDLLLAESPTAGTLPQRIVDELYRALPHYSLVALFRREGENLMLDVVRGLDPAQAQALSTGLATVVTSTRTSLLLTDIGRDQRARPAREDMIAELTVPVIRGEQVVHVFDIQSDRWGALGRADQELIEWLATRLAGLNSGSEAGPRLEDS